MDVNQPPQPVAPISRWRRWLYGLLGKSPLSGCTGAAAASQEAPIPDKSFRYGDGPDAILLIHGLTGTPVEIQTVGRGLAQQGFSVYGVQLAGHCGSEAALMKTGWHDWYRSVEDAWRELDSKHSKVFVAGMSMGAVMAMHLAAQHPGKISGLGLYSTTLFYDGWAVPKLAFLLPLFLRTPFGDSYRFIENFPYGIKNERLRDYIHKSMMSGDSELAGNLGMSGGSLRELRRLIAIVKREMPAVSTPALVVHAQHDDVTSTRNAEYVAKHLGGPVRVELLHDCYHMITLDQERDEVVRLSAEFFRTCAGDTSA
ncbi:MAG: alpha/beta fold hydrolase [Proteobacteria bacterium]|nr:alpha/beta fold hydrolase [Pseudomonadota bacterium]